MGKSNKLKDRRWEIIFALFLVSMAFLLIIIYYIVFPLIRPEIQVPCTVNIIITTLLAFGTAFGIKLVDIKK
jgi:hypothetical protein